MSLMRPYRGAVRLQVRYASGRDEILYFARKRDGDKAEATLRAMSSVESVRMVRAEKK